MSRKKPIVLGTLVAERALHVADNSALDIRVRIGMPLPDPTDHETFYCPYQIVGLGDEQVRCVFGVGSLQALELALLILPTAIDVLRRGNPGLGGDGAQTDSPEL